MATEKVNVVVPEDASFDFITKLVMASSGKLLFTSSDANGSLDIDSTPKLLLVKSRNEKRKYGACEVTIYKFLLMDRSGSILKAQTDTCMSRILADKDIMHSSLLTITDYSVVWMVCPEVYHWKAVMILKQFTWSPPTTTPIFTIGLLSSNLDWVDKESRVTFMVDKYIPESERSKEECPSDVSKYPFPVRSCDDNEIRNGKWIRKYRTKQQWYSYCVAIETAHQNKSSDDDSSVASCGNSKPKKSTDEQSSVSSLGDNEGNEEKECGCVTDFAFNECIVKTHPVTRVNKFELFLSASHRVKGETSADKWKLLSPSHKRWCLYWWYAVNVYQIRSAARPLPACLLDHVCDRYPNLDGKPEYTGFKSSTERAKHRMMKKKKETTIG